MFLASASSLFAMFIVLTRWSKDSRTNKFLRWLVVERFQPTDTESAWANEDLPVYENLPTLKEIREKMPKDMFVPSTFWSLYYCFRAIGICLALGVAEYAVMQYVSNPVLRALATLVYWFYQGVALWGFFTLQHDMGHGSFSKSSTLNYWMGNLFASPLMVPYESWRLSHRHHHKTTNDIDNDEIFMPTRFESAQWFTIFNRTAVFLHGAGYQLYLWFGFTCHFWPFAPMYKRRKMAVTGSILCVFGALYLVKLAIDTWGFQTVAIFYVVPLFWQYCMLVITTFNHHADIDVPWFHADNWNFVKGNLCSIDRSYGWLVDILSHNIGTHQIHHLFIGIPHYKLNEATRHFRAAYPQLVRSSDHNPYLAFIQTAWANFWYGVCGQDVREWRYAAWMLPGRTPTLGYNSTKVVKQLTAEEAFADEEEAVAPEE